jgi:flagellar protein FliO/FliZ
MAALLLCGHLAAAPAAPAEPPMLYPRASAPSGGLPADGSGIGSMGLIGAALAAAAGGWLLWSRYRGNRRWGGRSDRLLSVAETRPLGNRQYLVVAAYGRRRFLLGVCPARIDLLSPLDDDPSPSP